jgi:alkanesulfonate monooxygenase SsuD/methylene tetrahydromethanopterin reductase-like flavin-dependent oxidoreductase (luciferase family)
MSGADVVPEFHLYLPQMRLSMDAMVEKAQAAEAAGFVGMAGMDHLAPPMAEQHDMYEALTTNAWLLARTERLVQGQLVLCDAFRHPAVLAREAVTLDHASGGRFELGIGWGSVIEEFTTFGVTPTAARERVRRLAETLDLLELFWTGEAFDYEGHFFQLRGARQVPTPLGRIPVLIGGTGKRTMELVAAHADWWNVPIHQLERLDDMRASAGDARVSVQQMFAFVPEGVDRAEVEEPARRRFGYHNLVVGGRDQMVDHFSAMREHGVERFYVWFADFAPPATLAEFAENVIARHA